MAGVPVGQLRSSPIDGRSRACRRGSNRSLGAPGHHATSHTYNRAHTLTPCGISQPRTPPLGGARESSPSSKGWGAPGTPGPGPGVEAVRPLPTPFPCPGLAPPLCYPSARGGPRGSWARSGRGWGAGGGRGLRAERRFSSAPGKVWTWETPSLPAPPRGGGARGPGAGTPATPAAGGSPPPTRRLPAAPAGQGAPSWMGSLSSAAIRPPLPRHPALLPRGAARGSPQSSRLRALREAGAWAPAGGRVRSPAAARRSQRESGRERGSRGGVCARVCERGSEGARE